MISLTDSRVFEPHPVLRGARLPAAFVLRRILTFLVIALIGYDGLLHLTTLIVGRNEETGRSLVALPWLLFPTFPTWFEYDVVWCLIHLLAFVILIVAVSVHDHAV